VGTDLFREAWWHGHRMLVSSEEDVILLRTHADDRHLYEASTRRVAQQTAEHPSSSA